MSNNSSETSFNRLADEKSAYLLQHKDNPVHWWPFGPEALLKAKEENKPIFLSVGYSSCHWCHVMAHESFEDQETADLMNEKFINIKVDREEFPDIDSYYQQACQLFIQQGGWPLSVFLLPDLKPYFAGTYFPLHGKEGHASFKQVLTELSRAYSEDSETVLKNANEVTEKIKEGFVPNEKVEFEGHFPHPSSIAEALKQYEDAEGGGYGTHPKFPHFPFLTWASEQMLEGMINKEQGGNHIVTTFEKMLMGGLNDHARGGFHRYSVDNNWKVPHFEKMLYDQAGLLSALSKFSLLYPSPLVYDTIINTLDYLESEMFSEEGYFFSAQDADSEGQEGLYFTFTEEEFEDLVNKCPEEVSNKMDDLKKWFEISKEGNFENGLSVISLNHKHSNEIFTQEGWEAIREVRKQILEERKNRIPPATDSKGVASWNFMMITALVDTMQYVQIDVIKKMASRIFNNAVEGTYKNFLASKDESGMRLRHTTTKDKTLPYFEDYVFFTEAQLRIYEITGNPVFKDNVVETLHFILKEFIDSGKALTRAKSTNDFELYPNQDQNSFDNSFKSPLSTLTGLIRRVSVLAPDEEFSESAKELVELVTHECLKNPLAAGEALRSLTYPEQAYRVVKLPKTWLAQDKFIGFMNYFLPRFVLSYHEDGDDWQICNSNSCELQGTGLDNFIETLRPSPPEESSSDDPS
ncbi:MAG: hypothetical protein CME70_15785 [Halobacteriovorax sp.]|nr:hypothetical protein [Halobacteriovorax sp.]|tara:strand:+ start:23888 stop:25966 length:2079 start_codon:yes stop_codon:yes gene_type:complete